ncbi:MAG TPA: GyrI-like domain-containing protein [Cyclobacteriaceae bacterium]
MTKLDLSKKYKSYYSAKSKPEIITVEEANYLSITGTGDPSAPAFAERIATLYPVAYALKFAYKEEGKDFVVAKLEGQWWFDEGRYKDTTIENAPLKIPRSEWNYRILIRLPEFITKSKLQKAVANVVTKKKLDLANEIQFFTIQSTKAVQMLHVGPFDKEPETLKVMAEFMNEYQFQRNGLHHEIYLSDFRKTIPSKLRTILREPVK